YLICHGKSLSCKYDWKNNRLFSSQMGIRYLQRLERKTKIRQVSIDLFFSEIPFLKSGPVHTPIGSPGGGAAGVRVSFASSIWDRNPAMGPRRSSDMAPQPWRGLSAEAGFSGPKNSN